MKTLIKIAWRNVWRNGLRSGVVITSVAMGIWAGLFMLAFVLGLNKQRMEGAIQSNISHLQLHDPAFIIDQNVKYVLKDADDAESVLSKNGLVKSFCSRVVVAGMAASANGSYGVQVLGIEPEREMQVSDIATRLDTGTYFTAFKKNPVVIGRKLADKLKLRIRSKLIVTFQDAGGEITSGAFRVEGIFKTSNSLYDESTLFVRQKDISNAVSNSTDVHEIAILCNDLGDMETVKADLETKFPDIKIQGWNEISPELGYADELMGRVIVIFLGIILLALTFGIINTMLMAVLERKRELGMLMSIGMNKGRVFLMIMFETVFLSAVATPIGIGTAYAFITYFGNVGIDLSAVAEGLESLGVGAVIYTTLESSLYITMTSMTILATFLASIYPAIKALSLNPAEAVRSL